MCEHNKINYENMDSSGDKYTHVLDFETNCGQYKIVKTCKMK